MTAVQLQNPKARALPVRRSRLLNRITIGWNLAEGVIALVAGTVAGSVSLVGFGLDSGIEVSAAAILAWRLAKEGRSGCMADFDRRATRLIAGSFAALAAYVGFRAPVTWSAIGRQKSASSASGWRQCRSLSCPCSQARSGAWHL